ncbi:MAG TPA: hypothetical protein VFI68_09695 [Anaerolineales bacterium]|nr:hypothetical protein [Anaerolineales bacterium]
MSKPIARVVFSVLIALALVVGIYSSVRGASQNAGTKSGQSYVLTLGLSQNRASTNDHKSFGAQAESFDRSGHDCQSDSMINPEDY